MTYLDFLLIFLVPPIVIQALFIRRLKPGSMRQVLIGIGFLSTVAVVYTTPWDNYLVKNGIWWYGADKVLGVIGYVPIEEYMFFVLQTVLTGLGLFVFRKSYASSAKESHYHNAWVLGCVIYFTLSLLGVVFLFDDSTLYLGLILAWACPIMMLQWFLGGKRLLACGQTVLGVIGGYTLYLSLADSLAIHLKIWTIAPKFTTGIVFGSLPLEEMVFFLATNILVVQGLELAWSYLEGWEIPLLSKDSKLFRSNAKS